MIQFNLVSVTDSASSFSLYSVKQTHLQYKWKPTSSVSLQKGGVPAAPSGTATLLRLSKARERIHRAVADARLLANPASWSRVADSSPN